MHHSYFIVDGIATIDVIEIFDPKLLYYSQPIWAKSRIHAYTYSKHTDESS